MYPCTRAYIYLSRYYLDKKDFQNVELYAKKCLGLVQTREHGNQMLKIITEMSGKFNQVSTDGLYPLVGPNEYSFQKLDQNQKEKKLKKFQKRLIKFKRWTIILWLIVRTVSKTKVT